MPLEVLVTERLRGERLGPHHVDVLLPIFSDPRVGATMGGVADRAQLLRVAEAMDAHWRTRGFGYMMWFDQKTGAPVARGGLARTVFDGVEELEVGWTTVPERWGEGIATELGQACVDWAFDELRAPDLVAFTLVANRPSRRVMEKLGFAYEKTAPHREFGDHVLYRLMNTST